MKLSGRCKEDFYSYLVSYYRVNRPDYNKYSVTVLIGKFLRSTKVEQNAFIIEFLDSIDIITWVSFNDYTKCCFNTYVNEERLPGYSLNRREATDRGIEEANEIYNNNPILY